jgi:hypothetical protein
MKTKEFFSIYMNRRVCELTTSKYIGYLKEISKHLCNGDEDFVYGKSSETLVKLRAKLHQTSFIKRVKGTQQSYLVAYDWLIKCNQMIERNSLTMVRKAA